MNSRVGAPTDRSDDDRAPDGSRSTRESVIELRGVGRTHGAGPVRVVALREVSLVLRAGEMVAVMGPSGSGKSTLLNIAGGLDQPDTGEVLIGGIAVGDVSSPATAALRRRAVGFVFQRLNLVPTLTAAENVSLPLELDGVRAAAARRVALEALEAVGIVRHADGFPDELSGGIAQRVAIARAIVGDRAVILADEPTGALDSVVGESIMELLRGCCERGAACLVVTHEPRYAGWADQVIFLRDGMVIDQSARVGVDSLLDGAER